MYFKLKRERLSKENIMYPIYMYMYVNIKSGTFFHKYS